ncbi:MAG: GIY-YIG nuclease family protein [Candidatus Babeliaceae bacterium]|nr:GIY-YIG nuclease family protein [Candidatus Babeliaceae bacterium]
MNNFYVYVYIDPRNFEEFYYGKGKGWRKEAHLWDTSSSEKTKRIKAIRREGLEPIIRVIASRLNEQEAFLIEKTLLWKLGKLTTNVSSGHFKNKFRPHNTMHKKLPDFDYQNGIYFYNVGEGPHRNWDDYRKYGFISAGQRKPFKLAMEGFEVGDIIIAYMNGRGFVGVGIITHEAIMVRDVKIDGKRLLDLPLKCKEMSHRSDSIERSEYVARVKWLRSVPREKAKWKKSANLFTPRLVRASLEGQNKTINFICRKFDIDLWKRIL